MTNVRHINQGAHYTPRKFTDAELLRDVRKVSQADLLRTIADKQAPMTPAEQDRYYAACTADKCGSGNKPCPTPHTCVIDTDSTPPARALRFFARLVQWLPAPKP